VLTGLVSPLRGTALSMREVDCPPLPALVFQALVCSLYLPFYCGVIPPEFRGEVSVWGGPTSLPHLGSRWLGDMSRAVGRGSCAL
jgi:hypothetical protein